MKKQHMNAKELKKEKQKYLDYLRMTKLTEECLTFKEWLEERQDYENL